MYTLYKFHFLNGISEINQLFDDILIIWPAPVYIIFCYIKNRLYKLLYWQYRVCIFICKSCFAFFEFSFCFIAIIFHAYFELNI